MCILLISVLTSCCKGDFYVYAGIHLFFQNTTHAKRLCLQNSSFLQNQPPSRIVLKAKGDEAVNERTALKRFLLESTSRCKMTIEQAENLYKKMIDILKLFWGNNDGN